MKPDKYDLGIAAALGGALTLGAGALRGLFTASGPGAVLSALCDGLLTAAVVLACLGFLARAGRIPRWALYTRGADPEAETPAGERRKKRRLSSAALLGCAGGFFVLALLTLGAYMFTGGK